MKMPKDDKAKRSLPGEFAVLRQGNDVSLLIDIGSCGLPL